MKIEISARGPAFAGTSFGAVGPYEKITGRCHDTVDPAASENAVIVNLECAPRNADGRVAYAVDFCILQPTDPVRGNRRILFDTLNRGDKLALIDINGSARGPGSNDPTSAADAGNGFLMRRGYTLVFSAWQGGLNPDEGHMLADFPVATDNGAPLTGLTREEIVFGHATSPARAPLTYPSASVDAAGATLTVRQHEHDARVPLAAAHWRLRSAQEIEIDRPAGYGTGAIYEFIYRARDPIVMGLGFAAVRDVVSCLRYQARDDTGNPNPLSTDGMSVPIDHVIAYGRSQPGRFLREFVRLGFNEDRHGRQVFDGLFAAIAGSRRIFLNEPFAQPGRFHRQHEDHAYPGDQFPFTYASTTDTCTGETGGILARALERNTCPKIIHIDSSTEFWQGRSSLLVSDADGRDVPLPDEVRLYLFSGTMHAGPAMLAHPGIYSQNPVHALNDVDYTPLNRALIIALDDWVSGVRPPPPSRYPSVGDGTLVAPFPQDAAGFPSLPGVHYPRWINQLSVMDYSTQPPRAVPGKQYAVLVPAVDADGNERAGVRLPDIAVPRATYTGWNMRDASFAADALMLVGACFPFAATRAERERNGDPRPSIEERYPSREIYLEQVRAAAQALADQHLLLDEDIARCVAVAERRATP